MSNVELGNRGPRGSRSLGGSPRGDRRDAALMGQQELLDRLEAEYDRQDGFLGQLREGVLRSDDARRFLDLLEEIEIGESPVDVRLVRFLWFTPVFIQWQKERIELLAGTSSAVDPAAIEEILNHVISLFEERVGVPSEVLPGDHGQGRCAWISQAISKKP